MPKYLIEGAFDFYSELYKSLDDYENNFNHQFIYYKKKEAIKAIKEKIDNLIN